MDAAVLKFRTRISDVIAAMERYAGITDVVVESDEDATGILNCLIQVAGCGGGYIKSACTLDGETILVRIRPEFPNANDHVVPKGKAVQQLILSAKGRT